MKALLYYTGSNADVWYYLHSWEFDKNVNESSVDETNFSRINDIAFNADFNWMPHRSHNVRFGTSYQFHIYSPSRRSLTTSGTIRDEKSLSQYYQGNEFSLYAEDEITVLDRISLNLGLRYAMSAVPGKTWTGLNPGCP